MWFLTPPKLVDMNTFSLNQIPATIPQRWEEIQFQLLGVGLNYPKSRKNPESISGTLKIKVVGMKRVTASVMDTRYTSLCKTTSSLEPWVLVFLPHLGLWVQLARKPDAYGPVFWGTFKCTYLSLASWSSHRVEWSIKNQKTIYFINDSFL